MRVRWARCDPFDPSLASWRRLREGSSCPARSSSPRLRSLYDLVAIAPPDEEQEAWVHDVRVASRRFVEALEMARSILPEEEAQKANRRAKRLRRRLGRTRELDVVCSDFRNLALRLGLPEVTVERVEDIVFSQRDAASAYALGALPEAKIQKHRDAAEALSFHNVRPDIAWRDLAAEHLARRSQEAEDLIPTIEDPSLTEQHHRLRIRIKRLRYALELAEELISPLTDPRPLLRSTRRMQDSLGILNDAADLKAFLRRDDVTFILGRFRDPALEEATAVQARRFSETATLVRAKASATFGLVRRVAGRMGLFQRTELRGGVKPPSVARQVIPELLQLAQDPNGRLFVP
ncbi:MAG: CHAD domain-containing protein [Myxococcales bacterium]|nr:CHAD domain-containing protein [Myxococcales bacterium]